MWTNQLDWGRFKTSKSEGITFSPVNKIHIFQCIGRIFCVEIEGNIWNSIQNILPLHWKMRFLYKVEILRDLTFKSSPVFLKQSPCVWHLSCYYVDKLGVYSKLAKFETAIQSRSVVDCGPYDGASIITMHQCRESISPKPVSIPLKKRSYTWLSDTK